MRQQSILFGTIIAIVAFGIFQTVKGQDADTTTVICAPCAGEPFGASGVGMVLMNSYNGSGQLWFYPLDRSQAQLVRTSVRFGASSELRSTPTLIGRLSVGSPMVWPAKE